MPDEIATSEDIHAVRDDVPLQTIRRLMRQGAPWFPGAVLVGRTRVVPVREAEYFAEHYARYARKDSGSGDLPPEAPDPLRPLCESQEPQ
jgi:capsular polysaccharide biosynthesis protein